MFVETVSHPSSNDFEYNSSEGKERVDEGNTCDGKGGNQAFNLEISEIKRYN